MKGDPCNAPGGWYYSIWTVRKCWNWYSWLSESTRSCSLLRHFVKKLSATSALYTIHHSPYIVLRPPLPTPLKSTHLVLLVTWAPSILCYTNTAFSSVIRAGGQQFSKKRKGSSPSSCSLIFFAIWQSSLYYQQKKSVIKDIASHRERFLLIV